MTAKEYRAACRRADYIRLKRAGGQFLKISRAQALAWANEVAAGVLLASEEAGEHGRWLWLF